MSSTVPSVSQYRYDQVREFQTKLKTLTEEYQMKIKKYRQRITVIDVTVYSVSGVITGAGIILSLVTMIAPIAVTICISAATTIAEIISTITKRISSCSQRKLQDYIIKFHVVSTAYSQLSSLISSSLDDTFISDSEFSAMVSIYDFAMSKLEIQHEYNNNDNNARNSKKYRTDSTNNGKYHTGEDQHYINNLNES